MDFLYVTPSLISRNPREQKFFIEISLLGVTFPFPYTSQVLTLKFNHQRIQTTRSHGSFVIIVFIVIIAMLTLCHSIMSHVFTNITLY